MELFKQKRPVTGSGVSFLGCLLFGTSCHWARVCVCVFHALQHSSSSSLLRLCNSQDDGFPLSSTDATFQTRRCFNL